MLPSGSGLPSALADFSTFSFPHDGTHLDFDAFLAATDTDGLVVIHRGMVVADQRHGPGNVPDFEGEHRPDDGANTPGEMQRRPLVDAAERQTLVGQHAVVFQGQRSRYETFQFTLWRASTSFTPSTRFSSFTAN